MNPVHLDNVKVNFILGPGRSGTALMMWILNTHPQCIALPEVRHVIHFFQKYNRVETVTQDLINDLTSYFAIKPTTHKLRLFNFNSEAFFGDLKPGQKISYHELCLKIYSNYSTFLFPEKKTTTIIDKNPLYTTRVDDLSMLFKEAKFLFMIRDYRAYVLSSYENYSKRNKIYSAHLYSFFWLNHMLLINKNLKKRNEKCLLLRYEDFISNAPEAVKNVCAFFEITYSDNLLEYYKVFEKQLPELETQITDRRIKKIRKLSKPINPARLSSWNEGLTNFQVKRIEFWCSKLGSKFNYAPTLKISFPEKILYFIEGFPLYVLLRIYFLLASFGFFTKRKRRR